MPGFDDYLADPVAEQPPSRSPMGAWMDYAGGSEPPSPKPGGLSAFAQPAQTPPAPPEPAMQQSALRPVAPAQPVDNTYPKQDAPTPSLEQTNAHAPVSEMDAWLNYAGVQAAEPINQAQSTAEPATGAPGFFGGLADAARGAAHGLATLPSLFGQAAQFGDRALGGEGETGKGLAKTAEQVDQAVPSLKESQVGQAYTGALSPRGMAYEGSESTVQSLALPLAGAATGAAIGSLAGPGGALLGGAIGGIGGTVATVLGFAGQQGEETYEKVRAKGGTHAEAMQAGLLNAGIEGVGEAAGDYFTLGATKLVPPTVRRGIVGAIGRAFGAAAEENGGRVIADMASNQGAMVRAIKDIVLTVIPTEVATEMGQQWGEQKVEAAYGAAPEPTLDDSLRVVVPTLMMSLVAGGSAHGYGAVQRAQVNQALTNPSDGTPDGMDRRLAAAQVVGREVEKLDSELAGIWNQYATSAIAANKPLVVDEDAFYRDIGGKDPIAAARRAAQGFSDPATLEQEALGHLASVALHGRASLSEVPVRDVAQALADPAADLVLRADAIAQVEQVLNSHSPDLAALWIQRAGAALSGGRPIQVPGVLGVTAEQALGAGRPGAIGNAEAGDGTGQGAPEAGAAAAGGRGSDLPGPTPGMDDFFDSPVDQARERAVARGVEIPDSGLRTDATPARKIGQSPVLDVGGLPDVAPDPGAIAWDDQPLGEDLFPGQGGLWTRQTVRSQDGAWAVERAINPDGEVVRERVGPIATVAQRRLAEVQGQYQGLADQVTRQQAAAPDTPSSKEDADQLSRLRLERDRWQKLVTQAAPPVVPAPAGPSPEAQALGDRQARKVLTAIRNEKGPPKVWQLVQTAFPAAQRKAILEEPDEAKQFEMVRQRLRVRDEQVQGAPLVPAVAQGAPVMASGTVEQPASEGGGAQPVTGAQAPATVAGAPVAVPEPSGIPEDVQRAGPASERPLTVAVGAAAPVVQPGPVAPIEAASLSAVDVAGSPEMRPTGPAIPAAAGNEVGNGAGQQQGHVEPAADAAALAGSVGTGAPGTSGPVSGESAAVRAAAAGAADLGVRPADHAPVGDGGVAEATVGLKPDLQPDRPVAPGLVFERTYDRDGKTRGGRVMVEGVEDGQVTYRRTEYLNRKGLWRQDGEAVRKTVPLEQFQADWETTREAEQSVPTAAGPVGTEQGAAPADAAEAVAPPAGTGPAAGVRPGVRAGVPGDEGVGARGVAAEPLRATPTTPATDQDQATGTPADTQARDAVAPQSGQDGVPTQSVGTSDLENVQADRQRLAEMLHGRLRERYPDRYTPDSKPSMSAFGFADAIRAHDADALGVRGLNLTDPGQRAMRQTFTDVTGIKLPRTVSGSQAAIRAWAAQSSEAEAPAAAASGATPTMPNGPAETPVPAPGIRRDPPAGKSMPYADGWTRYFDGQRSPKRQSGPGAAGWRDAQVADLARPAVQPAGQAADETPGAQAMSGATQPEIPNSATQPVTVPGKTQEITRAYPTKEAARAAEAAAEARWKAAPPGSGLYSSTKAPTAENVDRDPNQPWTVTVPARWADAEEQVDKPQTIQGQGVDNAPEMPGTGAQSGQDGVPTQSVGTRDTPQVSPGQAPATPAAAESTEAIVDRAIDEELDALFGPKAAAGPAPATVAAGAPAERTAGQAGASAVKHVAMGLDEIASGLTALFGGPGRLGSGPTFDEATYARAKPLFQAGVAHFQAAGADIAEMVRKLVQVLVKDHGLTRETVEAMRPYIQHFVADTQAAPAATIQAETTQETDHAGDRQFADQGHAVRRDTPGGPEPRGDRGASEGTDAGDSGGVPRGGERGTPGGTAEGRGEDGGRLRGGDEGVLLGGGTPDRGASAIPAGGVSGAGAVAPGARPEPQPTPAPQPGAVSATVRGDQDGPRPSQDLDTKVEDAKARGEEAGAGFNLADQDIGKGGPLTKARANLEALRLVKALQRDRRRPTAAEQAQIARYVGFGDQAIRQQLFPVGREPEGSWAEVRGQLEALLTAAELEEVQRSTQYAHYTSKSVVQAVWAGLKRLGATQGLAFEAGVGSGNFIGLMPDGLNLRYQGVEREPIAFGVAQALYPDAGLVQVDFTRMGLPQDHYDVVVGNPPFANTKISADKQYASLKFSLHNYFIAKQIDALRPGGVGAFVVSHYLMDAVGAEARAYIAKRADLVGAIRLPNTAFLANAGTKATTDILFFRKRHPGKESGKGRLRRLRGAEKPNGVEWQALAPVQTPGGETQINEYFLAHPEMVLGDHGLDGKLTASEQEYTVNPRPGADLAADLSQAVGRLPAGVYAWNLEQDLEARLRAYQLAPGERDGTFYLRPQDGGGDAVWQVEGGVGRPVSGRKVAKVRAYLPLRDAVLKVFAAQTADEDSGPAQAEMRKHWDAFVERFGALGKERTIVRSDGKTVTYTDTETALSLDPEFYRTREIEKYDALTDTVKPGPIFSEKIVGKPLVQTAASAEDALMISLNRRGVIDLAYMAELWPMDAAAMLDELGDAVYRAPGGAGLVPADQYLSGNVVAKLAAARLAAAEDAAFERNVKALEQAQPAPIEAGRIFYPLGATWVPQDVVRAFASDAMEFEGVIESWQAGGASGWGVQGRSGNDATFGTAEVTAAEVLDAALNARRLVIRKRVDKDTMVVDKVETAAANQKVADLREAFHQWVMSNPEVLDRLAEVFNGEMNVTVPWRPNGDHLTLPGFTSRYTPHWWQKALAWRFAVQGNTYAAHQVGAGKTLGAVITIMEARRLGLVKKVVVNVPKSTLSQWRKEWLDAYPGANLLVIANDDLDSAGRRRFWARAAMQDWDGIIVNHDAFKTLGLTAETTERLLRADIAELEAALDAMDADTPAGQPKSPTRTQIEQAKERIEDRIAAAQQVEVDVGVTFEELGVDMVVVDEAHAHKKMGFATTQSDIKGVDGGHSDVGLDLYTKARWLREINPGRNLMLLSGTPITNSIGEIFMVQRLLQPEVLERIDAQSFDSWAATFANVKTGLKMGASGQFNTDSRMNQVRNRSGLVRDLHQVMDIVDQQDLIDSGVVNLPQVKGGGRQVELVPASADYKAYQAELGERLKRYAAMKLKDRKQKGADNIPWIMSDGAMAAIDLRLQERVPSAPTKLDLAAERIAAIYHARKDDVFTGEDGKPEQLPGAVQLVFSDLWQRAGVFDGAEHVIDRLVALGVPRDKILDVRGLGDERKRKRAWRDTNMGKYAVLLGGTSTLGTGVNVQKRAYAVHHLDVPLRPDSIIQREGRIVRHGNQYALRGVPVEITAWAKEGSIEAFNWSLNEEKQRMIDSAMDRRDLTTMTIDNIETEADQMAMAMAMVSGDPRVLELAGLKAEVRRLESMEAAFHSAQAAQAGKIRKLRSGLANLRQALPGWQYAAARAVETKGDAFRMEVRGRTFTERSAAAKALVGLLDSNARDPKALGTAPVAVLGGQPWMLASGHGWMELAPQGVGWAPLPTSDTGLSATVSASEEPRSKPLGLIATLENAARKIPERAALLEAEIPKVEGVIAKREAQGKDAGAFQYGAETKQKRGRLMELEKELAPPPKEANDAVGAKGPAVVSDGAEDGLAGEDGRQARYAREPVIGPSGRVGADPSTVLRPGESPAGMTVEEVQRVVNDFGARLLGASAGRVPVQVFATQEQAFGPGSIDRYGRIKGAYLPATGRIVLIGAHLRDAGDATTVLRHEAVGHFGLNLLAPADKRAFLEQVGSAIKSNRYLRRLQAEVLAAEGPRAEPLLVAEEVFARAVESGRTNLGLAWDRLLLWLRGKLRALGLIQGRPGLIEMRVFAADIARGIRAGQAQRTFPGSDRAQFSGREQAGKADDVIRRATPGRQAQTLEQARSAAVEFVGTRLVNAQTRLEAVVSNGTLGKMTSQKAVAKSSSPEDHALAVANADQLFRQALLDRSHPDEHGEPTIGAIHRYVAPMIAADGEVRAVRMMVKETTGPKEPNPLYTIETLDVEKPTRLAPSGEGIERGIGVGDVATTPTGGLAQNIADALQNVKDALANRAQVPKKRFSREPNGPAFAADMQAQAEYLDREAKSRHFVSLDDLAAQDLTTFVHLAEQWRDEHPASYAEVRFSRDSTLAPTLDAGGSPIGGGRRLWDSIKAVVDGTGEWAGDKWRGALPQTLGAVTLRQLADLGAKHIPGIVGYTREQQRMDTRRNEMVEESGIFADQWETWARKRANKAMAEETAGLMHAATLAQVDPSDYQVLQVALQLGPGELFWRNREATVENVKALTAEARRLIRSTKSEDRGLAGYYIAAAKQLKASVWAEKKRAAALPELERRWKALSPEAQGFFRGARDMYEKRSKSMMEALVARVQTSEALDEASKTKLAKQIRQEFERTVDEKGNPRIGPYFPLQRFGRFYAFARRFQSGEARTFTQLDGKPFASEAAARGATSKRTDLKGIEAKPEQLADGSGWVLKELGEPWFGMFESIGERRQALAGLRADGWTIERQGLTQNAHKELEGVSEGFMADAVAKLKARGAEAEADMLYQMYLNTLHQMSIRKHFVHRKGTAGFSNDALRAFGWNMMRLANQVAKLEHVPRLERLLREIEVEKKDGAKDLPERDVTVADAFMQELQKRHKWIVSPDNAAWTNFTSGLGFAFYLGASPAAALVNLTQTPIIALPVLAAKFGWKGSAKTLGRAFLDVSRGFSPGVVKGFLTGRPRPSEAANLSEEEREAFAAWDLSGVRDRTQAHNLAGIGDTDTFWSGPAFNRGMAIISSGFHAAEVVNRDTTLLAGYRLGRAGGMGHREAIQAAEDATWEAHFDYSNASRARWMQPNAAKALLMFRSYGQHMTYFMWRNLYQSVKGESAEVRHEARTKFLGLMGMTGLFAGTLGLPVLGTLFAVANLAAAAFGDDDEPWDAETEFRNWLAATFPSTVADILDRGAVTKATGLDWSSRVSLRELLYRSPDRDLDGAGTKQHIMEQFFGPLGGIASGPFTAFDLIQEGHWERAAEAVAPKALKDVLTAGRFASEGVLTKKGVPLVEDLNPYQVIWKAMGMNPDEIAVRQDANSAVKLYEGRIEDRRSRLMTAYAMATIHGDSEAQTNLLPKISAFNQAQPGWPITPRGIRTSVRNRERSALQAEQEHGMVVNRRLAAQVREAGAFGE